MGGMGATVVAVSRSSEYTFSKPNRDRIDLVAGLGVEDDVHSGVTVKHRSRIQRDPTVPNLRQVHLIHAELHDEVARAGYTVRPGELGENVTTRGLDLLGLPTGTRLRFGGGTAEVEITGLRNPCQQINTFAPGLLKEVLGHDADGNLVRKAGIMAVVLADGPVRPGDPIEVLLPPQPHRPLEPV
jgi:MOSC domain-containing protein YiiM